MTSTSAISVSLRIDQVMDLDRLTEESNINRSRLIREAIDQWFETDGPTKTQLLQRVSELEEELEDLRPASKDRDPTEWVTVRDENGNAEKWHVDDPDAPYFVRR